MKRFVIEYPDARLNRPIRQFARTFKYQKVFFDLLELVLKEEKIPYRKVLFKGKPDNVIKSFGKNEIYLAYHKRQINKRNAWTIKEAYTVNELYFDRNGYSGWAEIANNRELFEKSQQEDLQKATKFLERYVKTYRQEKLTKYKQPSTKISLPEEFILVAMQVPNDTVTALADIPTYALANMVAQSYKGVVPVVVKPHPLDGRFSNKIITSNNAIVVKSDIDDMIPRASAVYTVNSGVGFESLLYGTPVYTSGHSDYHWATTRIRNRQDIDNTKGISISRDVIVKFLYFYIHKYLITYNSKEMIRNKILEISKNV